MPSNLLNADTSFPQFAEGQSDKEKIEKITSYLFMLLEQLRYSMSNLDKDNFNDAGLEEISDIITEPVYLQLSDESRRITALQVTAAGLGARISDAEGNITALSVTSNALTSRITNAEGSISTLSQTVNGMTLSVTNGSASSTLRLLANGVTISSQNIFFSGMVSFTDLSTSGMTTINGDNIKTGTVEAIDIHGCSIEGSTFRTLLSSSGGVGGDIEFCYLTNSQLAGGIRLDDQGAGSTEERRYRMFIYTRNVSNVGFAMKLESASGTSITAVENIHIRAGTTLNITCTGGDINLNGAHVYVNGTEIGVESGA